MANSFNLTAQINLQGPKNVKQVASQIKKQLGNISADVNITVDKNASKNVGQLNKNLIALKKNALAARGALAQLGSTAKSVTGQYKQLSSASSKLSDITKKNNSDFKNTKDQVGKAATAIEDFGKQSALAVKRFAAFTVVTSIVNQFTGAIANATSEFIEFDRQLVRIAQVTGGTKKQLKDLSTEITRLGSAFGVSSSSLAEVSVTLSQAGLSATETRIALQALAKADLAPTFDNLKNTTEGAIAALRQFRLSANELEGALGSINAVAGKFAVESSDIITAIQRVGGVFASSSRGISEGQDALNEFIALFTSVRATTRESAETIATGLRTIFTRIQRGSTIDFLRELGVELQDVEGKFVGPFEAVRRLSEGLAGIDPRSGLFNKVIEELGGFRQVGKVIPLLQEFATAQKALGVAQAGSGSLTDAATKAQLALAVQISKVREEFLGLIRDIGESKTFQFLTGTALSFASALIKVVGAFKPILPLLAALTASKGFEFLSQFGKGFSGALKGVGGAAGVGANMGDMIGGGSKADSAQNMSANTAALVALTTEVKNLTAKIAGGSIGMNRGGSVPGTGNTDSVPAMLTPGEFVIRKSAVQAFGADNLADINKYSKGDVVKSVRVPKKPLEEKDLANSGLANAAIGAVKGILFEKDFSAAYGTVMNTASKFPDVTNPDTASSVVQGAKALELKYEDNQSTRAKYRSSLNKAIAEGKFTSSEEVPMVTRAANGGKMSSGSDTVPALLTPGEFVINKASARAFGYGNLKKINGYNKGGVVGGVQHFSNGGVVDPAVKGTIDYLDKNLRGMGDLLRDVISKSNASKEQQIQLVDRFANQIRGIDAKVEEFGEGSATAEALRGVLQDDIKALIDFMASKAPKAPADMDDGGAAWARIEAFEPGGKSQNVKQGGSPGLVGEDEAAAALDNLTNIFRDGAQKTKKSSASMQTSFQKTKRRVLAFGARLDDRLSAFGGLATAAGAGLTLFAGKLSEMGNTFANLTGQAAATSSAFQAATQGLQGAGSGIQSGAFAGAQAFGKKGAIAGAAVGGAALGLQGILQGLVDAEKARAEKALLSAEQELTVAEENLGTAISLRDKIDTFREYEEAIVTTDKANREAAAAADSFSGRLGDMIGTLASLAQIALTVIALRRGRGMSSGGMVYASSGQLIDFQPKGTDTVPAMLTPGEFVVNADATKKNIDVLKAINKSKGGKIGSPQYLQEGGMTAAGVARTAADFVPFVGSGLDAFEGAVDIAGGNFASGLGKLGMGIAGLALDTFTFGFGSVAKGVVKTGLKKVGIGLAKEAGEALTKTAVKETAKNVGKRATKGLVEKGGDALRKKGGQIVAGGIRRGGAAGKAQQIAGKAIGKSGKALTKLGSRGKQVAAALTIAGAAAYSFSGQTEEGAARIAAATAKQAELIVSGAKNLGERLPALLKSTDADDKVGLDAVNIKKLETLLAQDRKDSKKVFANIQDPSNLLGIQGLRQARLEGDTRADAEILKDVERVLKEGFLISQKNVTKQEAASIVDDPEKFKEYQKAFDNFATSGARAAASAAVGATNVDNLAKVTEGLSFVALKTSASLNMISANMNQIVSEADGVVAALAGQASATAGLRDIDSQRLANRQGVSAEDFRSTLDSVVSTGGGGAQLDRSAAILELKRAQEEVAARLPSDASGQFRLAEFEKAFAGIGKGLGPEFEDLKDTLASSAARAGEDPEAMKEFNAQVEKAQKLFQNIAKVKFEGLTKLAQTADKAAAELGKLTQLKLQGVQNFANDTNRLQQALGRTLTADEMNAGANASLGVFAGASRSDGVGVGQFAAAGAAARAGAQQAKRDQQAAMDMASGAEREAALAESTQKLSEFNAQSNAARQALEFLANDTTRLDTAMNKLAAQTKLLENQQSTFLDVMSDPEKFGKELANIQAAMQGQTDTAGTTQALKSLESLRGSMSEEVFQTQRNRIIQGGLQSGALDNRMAGFLTRSDRSKAGENEETNKLAGEVQKEINIRQQANAELQNMTQNGVATLNSSMVKLAAEINTNLVNAIRAAGATATDTQVRQQAFDTRDPTARFDPVTMERVDNKPNPFTDPLTPLPGRDLFGAPLPPPGAPPPPAAGGQAATGGGAGGVAGSVALDASAIPDSVTLTNDVNINANIPNLAEIEAVIVSKAVGTVSQALSDATNGGIRLEVDYVESDVGSAFANLT